MSVVAELSSGATAIVDVSGAGTAGGLIAAVHSALSLPMAREEYDMTLLPDDGESLLLADHAETPLGELGVYGCEEHVHVRPKARHIASMHLARRGITSHTDLTHAITAAAARADPTSVDDAVLVAHAAELMHPTALRVRLEGLLWRAVLQERLAEVRWLLRAFAGVDVLGTSFLLTCMEDTIGGRKLDVLAALLEACSLNSGELWEGSRKLVSTAVECGDAETLEVLLAHGARLPAGALVAAVRKGRSDIVGALLARGAAVDTVDGDRGWTPLIHAASLGRKGVAETLLAHGADLAVVDNDRRDALHYATANGHVALVRALRARSL